MTPEDIQDLRERLNTFVRLFTQLFKTDGDREMLDRNKADLEEILQWFVENEIEPLLLEIESLQDELLEDPLE